MSDHLSVDEVRALVEGRPPARGEAATDQHLLACDTCRTTVRKAHQAADARTAASDGGGEGAPAMGDIVDTPASRYDFVRTPAGALEELGRGGFGKVVLARDSTLGREVAMKRLTSERLARARGTSEARLLREARVMGQLEHPAIVPLHELGRGEDGQLYYTMRRIRGRTLADALKETKSLDERLRLLPHVLTACHAVAYAHSRGVVHRDLKPQNLMLDKFGATYLIDWGLAHARGLDPDEESSASDDGGALRLVSSDETIGDDGGRIGTLAYMSPEQLEGPRTLVDELSDVWGLGAMLYEVLTGSPPRNRTEANWRLPPRAVRERAADVPRDLAALCMKALAPRREDRYPSAEALAADLDAWLHGRQVSAHVYRPRELLARFVKANRVTVLVATTSLLALLVLGATSYLRVRTQRNQARAFAHLIVDQVLERLSATRDDAFVGRLTAEVTDWLQGQDVSGDAASVAWAWFLLARDADRVTAAPPEMLRACLDAGRGVDDPVARAAVLGCRALEQSPQVHDADPDVLAALERLWNETPADEERNTPQWMVARALLADRLSMLANALSEPAVELIHTDRLLALSRQALSHANDQAGAQAEVARALARRSLVASSLGDGPGALRFGDESVALARQAVALRADSNTASVLAANLGQQLSVLRWHSPDGEADPRRPRLGEEARQVFQSLLLLWPKVESIRYEYARALLELGDGVAAWDVARVTEFTHASSVTRGAFAWSAVAGGHSGALVGYRAAIEATLDFDTHVALGLALGLEGRLAEGAATLERAGALPMSSAWPAVTMARFVAAHEGPLGPGLRRFAAQFDAAQGANDDVGFKDALHQLAAEWRALPTPPR